MSDYKKQIFQAFLIRILNLAMLNNYNTMKKGSVFSQEKRLGG